MTRLRSSSSTLLSLLIVSLLLFAIDPASCLTDNLNDLLSIAPPEPDLLVARTPHVGARWPRRLQFLRVPRADTCRTRRSFLIMVKSAIDHASARRAIRETYGTLQFSPEDLFRVVFVVGNNDTYAEKIRQESDRFQDILQYDSPDTYQGLPVKTLACLRYVELCQASPITLKMDDDIMLSPWGFVREMQGFLRRGEFNRSTILGFVKHESPVVDDVGSKWYISPSVLPSRVYPPYVPGGAYAFPSEMAGSLRRAVVKFPLVQVDDAVVTGFARESINATLLSWGSDKFLWLSTNSMESLLNGTSCVGVVQPPHRFDTAWRALLAANTTATLDLQPGRKPWPGELLA